MRKSERFVLYRGEKKFRRAGLTHRTQQVSHFMRAVICTRMLPSFLVIGSIAVGLSVSKACIAFSGL